ncbi:MAG: thioredoxin-dependent thiol peroxidase [Bacteroidetes bacterium]|nr:thioredoxin-dependent thiol peroxidase [Bacteroidota bacterium]
MTFLKVGSKAPDFTAKDHQGKDISLKSLRGQKVILYFYPKDDTPGCTAEACNLRDNFDELRASGYVVVGVSADDETAHQKFVAKNRLPFALISDKEKNIIKKYGAWGTKKLYGREYEGILRITYVISEEGTISDVITAMKTKDHARQILGEPGK